MSQINHILAATDLSASARHAVERAAIVSKDTAAKLDLLHVANLAPLERLRLFMGASPAELERRVLDPALQKLQELSASLKQRFDVTAEARVTTGSLLAELAKRSQDLSIDLLVCGSKGESVIRHLALGTTAMRMLSTTTGPVLVVKQPPHEHYRRLLVSVDFSASSLRAIQRACAIAPSAELVLLHAFEVPFEGHLRYASVEENTINSYRIVAKLEATQRLHQIRDDAGLDADRVSLRVLHGNPALRILEQEQELDCDLIVMGKHGENFIEEMLLGSVTKHVLAESQGDLLITV